MKNIRFLGDGGDGCGSKRKQVRRACDSCRRGKRRCLHDPGNDVLVRQEKGTTKKATVMVDLLDSRDNIHPVHHQPQESLDPRGTHEQTQHSSLPISTSRPTVPFAGPSSAHSLLLSACRDSNMVAPGIDLDAAHRLPYSRILRPSFQDMRAPPSERRPGVGPGYLPMVVRAVLPYLEIECLQMIPPRRDLEALIQIFREEIHPILPIVDFGTQALTEPANGDNPASIIMRQAICLAACKNASARQYLNLPGHEDGDTLAHTPRSFADMLFGALKIAQDIGLVSDRVELVQVLALMAFHSYGPDGDDEVARLFNQAVHFAYSAGLHYPSSPESPVPEARRVELLYSLLALDKIIAMTSGRPTIIHYSEICLPAYDDAIMGTLPPGFKLLLFLSKMLDQVLDLYRAQPAEEMAREKCVWETSWPEFEDLAKDCKIQTMEPPLQACLELLYHVIGVISYRPPQAPPRGQRAESTSNSTVLPTIQSAKVRHKYCAQKISFLLGLDTSKLPFIPYAASLSLTVALRNMSQATLESTRTMAKDDVERSLRVLEGLTETYWHAESTGTIGRQIFLGLI
ncbi:uncharacterized protein GGS22DRAFT_177147 [Annulohypoxylon maeteangense]|uniref:uncharacterized protein n=1 Tax=Annulohypoxylon maeteangense TaxID=1927788 RepID=UPI0020078360|nr:uncharacterized protein GGS22DRAFT_177147 [Annulohypoxylon maeteangense]KAI0890103.1 hypothetical protein GGS22DRAFT_177147 [Annulohypoxylon maeteangense]